MAKKAKKKSRSEELLSRSAYRGPGYFRSRLLRSQIARQGRRLAGERGPGQLQAIRKE